jgi:hypothetical protein
VDREPLSIRAVGWLNAAALAIAYAALWIDRRDSAPYRAALAAGAIVIVLAITLTRPAGRRWLHKSLGRAARPVTRAVLAGVPWLALFALTASKDLWWTQRPSALRFFAEYALLNWSVCCAFAGRPERADDSRSIDRAVLVVAIVLAVLGLEGSAFGLTPFGAAASTLLMLFSTCVFVIAAVGSRSAGLALLTTTIATGIGLGIAEGGLRLLHAGDTVQESNSREYARKFYSLTPPSSAFLNQPKTLDEFRPALIETNSLGIRGPELPDPRADVLLIGDSFVEARQLPWEETIGPQLQAVLHARSSPLRVVAHGMRGWSPLLEWNWYLKVGRQLHPRVVLLFFFWNDLWPAGDEQGTFRARMNAAGQPDFFDVPVDADLIWYKHVRLVRLAEQVWQRAGLADLRRAFSTLSAREGAADVLDTAAAQDLARRLAPGPTLSPSELDRLLTSDVAALPPSLRTMAAGSFWPGIRPRAIWTDAQVRAAAVTESELQHFAADVRADGATFAIVYVPNPYQVSPRECTVGRLVDRLDTDVLLPEDSGVQAWLRDVTGRLGIRFLDPTARMRDADRERPAADGSLYLRADCHWSAQGHRFVAGYLADEFLAPR